MEEMYTFYCNKDHYLKIKMKNEKLPPRKLNCYGHNKYLKFAQ